MHHHNKERSGRNRKVRSRHVKRRTKIFLIIQVSIHWFNMVNGENKNHVIIGGIHELGIRHLMDLNAAEQQSFQLRNLFFQHDCN